MTKLYILHIYYTDDLYKDTYGYRTDIFNSKEKASVFAVKQLMKKILERCMDKGKFSASLFLEREIIDYGDKYEKFFDKSDEQLDKLKNELLDMYIQDMYDELYEDLLHGMLRNREEKKKQEELNKKISNMGGILMPSKND